MLLTNWPSKAAVLHLQKEQGPTCHAPTERQKYIIRSITLQCFPMMMDHNTFLPNRRPLFPDKTVSLYHQNQRSQHLQTQANDQEENSRGMPNYTH